MTWSNSVRVSCLIILILLSLVGAAEALEEMQYKQFKLGIVSCDVGILYKKTPDGMAISVSAIPFGNGAEFRKWRVIDIRLGIGDRKIKPAETSKFFVNKESFWKYPAAVLFAVIGAQMPVSGSTLDKTVSRTGAAIGLGLLTLAAEGDIAGERCAFKLDSATADRIIEGVDRIEITIENPGLHKKESVVIGLQRSPASVASCHECAKLDPPALQKMIDDLEGQVQALEMKQVSYRYGQDPEFDKLQSDIEYLETKRGIAYQALLDRMSKKFQAGNREE